MSDLVNNTTDANFENDVLKSEQPVLVDFWAPWCGPCKMIAPVLEEVAKEFDGRLKVVKLNVDENTESPAKYGVRGIPNLILFKDGEVVDSKVGALAKSQLVSFVEENV